MTQAKSSTPTVLILGAGMSGILAGIQLKEAGISTFEILEMGDSVGGTWRDNTYPGLSCDVPAHSYDYTFEPNWRWKSTYAEGSEIHAYFKHCADKYGVTPHVRFGTRITSVVREGGLWTVTSADGMKRQAQIVINCLGVLVHPMEPDIEGLKTFEGPILGAIIFFLLQEIFGDLGVWYLTGLGAIAVVFALYLPNGLWGTWRERTGIDLLSSGVVLRGAGTRSGTP